MAALAAKPFSLGEFNRKWKWTSQITPPHPPIVIEEKEHVGLGVILKKWGISWGVLEQENSCGISMGLGFWSLGISKGCHTILQNFSISRGTHCSFFYRISIWVKTVKKFKVPAGFQKSISSTLCLDFSVKAHCYS